MIAIEAILMSDAFKYVRVNPVIFTSGTCIPRTTVLGDKEKGKGVGVGGNVEEKNEERATLVKVARMMRMMQTNDD